MATYPGTVTPLRGLSPFTESERDVLFGRDRDRDELARMVGAEGFRAGLLHGESGVGKTSLLRAGLVPHLRDHGVVALFCEDPSSPAESFAQALIATGVSPAPGEQPMQFLARAVAQSLSGQLYVFIVDEIDPLLAESSERAIAEIGDLFARVVTRSGGRARFLFSCASERVHRFGVLERRTGSLFPPASRYELGRFNASDTAMVLERTLALAGIASDTHLAEDVAHAIARGRGALAAEIQIAALALQELGIRTTVDLKRLAGGARDLDREWLTRCARSTGNERGALWLLAELANGPSSPEGAAAHVGLDPTVAATLLSGLADKGVVRQDADGLFGLSHEILAPRVRETAAPARASAARAFELLGARAADGKRVPLRQVLALRREGIVPTTPAERGVIERSRRFWTIVVAAAVAVPILLLILIYVMMSGRYYLDAVQRGGGERIVVRAGRPALSAFDWMPASPGFGDVIADSGFTRAMVDPAKWRQVAAEDLAGDRDGNAFVDAARAALTPTLQGLLDYATTGSEAALEKLGKSTQGPEAMVALLEMLAPIARGGPGEVTLVDTAMRDASLAVQTSALAVATEAARRRPEVYQELLVRALTEAKPEVRRLAFAAVRELPAERAQGIFQAALAAATDDDTRRELAAVAAASGDSDKPTAADAAVTLSGRELAPAIRDRARAQLRRHFAADQDGATVATARLAGDAKATPEERVFAFDLLRELAPEPKFADLTVLAKESLEAKLEPVRAAALALYARVAPAEATELLASLPGKPDSKSKAMRAAQATAWGELARAKGAGAQEALDRLLGDDSALVKAAAAEAYGYLGRPAQEKLVKMVKAEGFEVAVGAARGLAHSTEVGGATSTAIGGIYDLYKRKGKPRREAAQVYASMATRPTRDLIEYLISSSRNVEDAGLHPIGVAGLCTAAGLPNGNADARRALVNAAGNESVEVRRMVIGCVADSAELSKVAVTVATKLRKDADPAIRAESARVLAQVSSKGKVSTEVAASLVQLLADEDRDVRLIAVRAVAALGADAPKETGAALRRAFEGGDEAEKLGALRTARALGIGDLVAPAISDPSSRVRIEAIDTAIATRTSAAPTISGALTDVDPTVRRAALSRLSSEKDALSPDEIDGALTLAVRDPDAEISLLAFTTMARVSNEDAVRTRLAHALASRSEAERARAAAAAQGLVERSPAKAVELLTPLLDDPSHDVRAAVLPALATAYAAINDAPKLVQMLRGAEGHAMRRLAATAAFVVLARTDAGRDAANTSLAQVADKGPAFARLNAKLAQGLIAGNADGVAFLQLLAP